MHCNVAHRKSVLELDTALKDIFRSRVFDLGSHIEISLPDDSSEDLPAQVKFNISAKYGSKPILFRYKSGWVREWWTNGVCHHPYDPCVVVGGGQVQQKLYKDENGFPHRIGGAAEITRVSNSDGDVYEEFWKISPGIKHRTDGGPASITAQYRNDGDLSVWRNLLDNESRVFIPRSDLSERFGSNWKSRYKDQKPVKHVEKRTQEWFDSGKPHRANKKYTSCSDHDSFEIVQMSHSLSMKTISLTATKEFKWQDEDGKLSRHNGPAIIKLYMVEEVTIGEKQESFVYEEYTEEWHYKGTRIPSKDVNEWLDANDIELLNEDSIMDKVLSPEDEFCFISDFLDGMEKD